MLHIQCDRYAVTVGSVFVIYFKQKILINFYAFVTVTGVLGSFFTTDRDTNIGKALIIHLVLHLFSLSASDRNNSNNGADTDYYAKHCQD